MFYTFFHSLTIDHSFEPHRLMNFFLFIFFFEIPNFIFAKIRQISTNSLWTSSKSIDEKCKKFSIFIDNLLNVRLSLWWL